MFESPRGRGNEGKVVSWLTTLPLFLPGSGEWKEDPENQRAAQNQLTMLAEIAVSDPAAFTALVEKAKASL